MCGAGRWKPVRPGVVALEIGGRWSGEAVEFIVSQSCGGQPIFGVATSLDAHAECVLCLGIRELLGGSLSGRVEWH